MNPHEVHIQSCLIAASIGRRPYRHGRQLGSVAVSPSTPRPAASVILLRRGGKHRDRALEVLLVKRSDDAGFMPGVWVFPGGSLDPADGEGDAGHRSCAVRELAEEAGIELTDADALMPYSRWITPEVVPVRFD